MFEFVLKGNPCSSCPGNEDRCSLEDETAKFSALSCDLISDWLVPRHNNKQNKLEGIVCKYCKSSDVVKRGIRHRMDHSVMQELMCHSCSRRHSVRIG